MLPIAVSALITAAAAMCYPKSDMSLTGLGEMTVIEHASFARKTILVCGRFVRVSPESLDAIWIVCSRSTFIVSSSNQQRWEKPSSFRNAYNIIDGMEGDLVKNPDNQFVGKRMKNGWKNSGLPWTYDVDPDRVRPPSD